MAVTAFPVILVDSATGSDTAASGAGPSTALTGSAGVTSADGLTVVLDGSPDLTNVLTDGSHVIFMSDTNAGSRNFSAINGKANSGTPTAQVTVEQAFQGLNTDAWAIGGKRAKIATTNSAKLFSNNSAAGDEMPGWVVQMQSGHTETLTGPLVFRRSGDQTSGIIELRGELNAATMPVLTFDNNGVAIQPSSSPISYLAWTDFELKNSNAIKTASVGISLLAGSVGCRIKGLRMDGTSNKFWKGILNTDGAATIIGCDIRLTGSHAIEVNVSTSTAATLIGWNYIREAGADGIRVTAAIRGLTIIKNAIYKSTGDGVGLTAAANLAQTSIIGNTFDLNVDGIDVAADLETRHCLSIINNIFSNNSGYGVKFNGATRAAVEGSGVVLLNNDFYNNLGATDIASYTGTGAVTIDPGYTSASGDNFSIGTNLKALAYPAGGTVKLGNSSTYTYDDIGAAQRQEAGGTTVNIINARTTAHARR